MQVGIRPVKYLDSFYLEIRKPTSLSVQAVVSHTHWLANHQDNLLPLGNRVSSNSCVLQEALYNDTVSHCPLIYFTALCQSVLPHASMKTLRHDRTMSRSFACSCLVPQYPMLICIQSNVTEITQAQRRVSWGDNTYRDGWIVSYLIRLEGQNTWEHPDQHAQFSAEVTTDRLQNTCQTCYH